MARINVPTAPDGPIPGENFTSDTKNYPWHRAPEFDDIDDAIEAAFKQLATKEGSHSLLTALQSGISVAEMTTILLISGVGAGKWTVDYALLMSGPVSHIMKIMAEGYGIKYEMGLKDAPTPTAAYYKEMQVLDSGRVERAVASAEDQLTEILSDNEDAPVSPIDAEASITTPTQKGGFMNPLTELDEENV